MPLYCFTSTEGETIEEFFPMEKVPKFVKRIATENSDTIPVVFTRDHAAEWKDGPVSGNKGEWPIVCYASGVHADQAQELRDHFKEHGCQTDVTSDGDPVYRDHQHRKRALKCRGLHDRASFGN